MSQKKRGLLSGVGGRSSLASLNVRECFAKSALGDHGNDLPAIFVTRVCRVWRVERGCNSLHRAVALLRLDGVGFDKSFDLRRAVDVFVHLAERDPHLDPTADLFDANG